MFHHLHDGVEILVGLGEGLAVRRDVAVVECVVRRAEFLDELEKAARAVLRLRDGAFAQFPRALRRAPAEHVAARAAHRVRSGLPAGVTPAAARVEQLRLGDDHAFLLEGGVYTADQIESYIELKWPEVLRFETTPSPVEFDMYYSA